MEERYFAAQVTPDRRYLYVSHLPGQGGKDWGYDFRATQAARLTRAQAARFRRYGAQCGFRAVVLNTL